MRVQEPHRRKYFQEYWIKNKLNILKQRIIYRKKYRKILINLMGGRCVICKFSNFRALQVDHINGGGNKEINSLGRSKYIYTLFRQYHENKKQFFKKYQLLCANCNWIKRYNNKEFKQD